jgi:hypothetical protein
MRLVSSYEGMGIGNGERRVYNNSKRFEQRTA